MRFDIGFALAPVAPVICRTPLHTYISDGRNRTLSRLSARHFFPRRACGPCSETLHVAGHPCAWLCAHLFLG